jgi:two-component system response regulator RegX3
MSQITILLADDESDYRKSLRRLLELEDYEVLEAATLQEAKETIEGRPLDLVLADLRFTNHDDDKDFSGLMVAGWAAERNVPCMIVTAFPSVEAARLALRSQGADPLAEDLIPKKDGPYAVLGAIQLVLGRQDERRPDAADEDGHPQEAHPGRGIEIDLTLGLAYLDGELLSLSKLQYGLLVYLYEREGAVCSAQEIIRAVYGEELTVELANADRRLERLIERVRDKIETNPHNPTHLLRVRGRGYRLVR